MFTLANDVFTKFFEHMFDFPRFYYRDETFKRSLAKLREDILRANGLAREANNFAEELGRPTRFSVTLQIPPQNLSPNRKVGLQFRPVFIFCLICKVRKIILVNGVHVIFKILEIRYLQKFQLLTSIHRGGSC